MTPRCERRNFHNLTPSPKMLPNYYYRGSCGVTLRFSSIFSYQFSEKFVSEKKPDWASFPFKEKEVSRGLDPTSPESGPRPKAQSFNHSATRPTVCKCFWNDYKSLIRNQTITLKSVWIRGNVGHFKDNLDKGQMSRSDVNKCAILQVFSIPRKNTDPGMSKPRGFRTPGWPRKN